VTSAAILYDVVNRRLPPAPAIPNPLYVVALLDDNPSTPARAMVAPDVDPAMAAVVTVPAWPDMAMASNMTVTMSMP
jgi:hypothetical protein